MNYLSDAIQILTRISSTTDYLNNDIIEQDSLLEKYLRYSYEQIITYVILTQINAISDLKYTTDSDIVLYPGCATDIIRCMLITKAKTIIGIDIVDSYFYTGLDQGSVIISENTKNIIELVHIIKQITYDLQIIKNIYSNSVNKDNMFDIIDISNNKLTIKFNLFDIPRTVIVYTGVDVNNININDFISAYKNINIVFLSGFIPNIKFFKTINPKYIFAPLYEFRSDITKTIDSFIVEFFCHNIDFININLMSRILDTIDITNPIIIEKAHLLCDIIGRQIFEIIQYL